METLNKKEYRDLSFVLTTQRTNLAQNGRIDILNIKIPSLKKIGEQRRLKYLNLSGSTIESLETLPTQPVLLTLTANNTPINSYLGLARHPRLSIINMHNTPLSKRPNFRLEMLLVVGQHLTKLNGVLITHEERNFAAMYPQISRHLIENGWNAQVPLPSQQEFRQLAIEYNLRIRGCDKFFTNETALQLLRPPPVLPTIPSMKETLLGATLVPYSNRPTKVEYYTESDADLINEITLELGRLGIHIPDDDNKEENIISSIKQLVEAIKMLEPCGEELIRMSYMDEDPQFSDV